MPTTPTCPECGKPLPNDAPQGLCPKCLLRHGMNVTVASSEAQPTIIAKPTIRYFGDYELDHEIARGGMGAVFKARQVTLNRPVAVKMILEGLLADEAMVKRFYTEAEAAANLQHPNIVAIHEIGAHDGQHYFSMDYVDGKDLSKVADGKPISPAKAARYVQSMASGIHYAHQRGTLHRDLKPSNVLIDEHDQPRITDFGLAKLANSGSNLTVDGAVMGTPSYMSPEQAAGRQDQIGPHSDVYSLGAILYELLTGKPPFAAATMMATMRAVIESDVIAPRKLNPDIPIDLETICLKCLEKAPQRRYSSARELTEELGRFLKGEPILARPASPIRRIAGWLRRHPGQLAALAAMVMLGLAVFVFYLTEQNAFLRAQLSTPGLVRQPGPIATSLKLWKEIGSVAFLAGFFAWFWFLLRSRGVKGSDKWSAPFNGEFQYRPMQPVGSTLRTVMSILGLVNLICAALLIGNIIRTYVWEGATPHFPEGFGAYLAGWQGLLLPWLAWQDYRRSVFGGSSRELPADLTEAMRLAVSDSDIIGAIRIYRRAVPDASLTEAREHVLRLMQHLGIKPPSFSLDTLNSRRLAGCAGIVALIVAVLWLLFPPSRSLPTAAYFGAGLFLGLTFTALPRIKGFSWRILFMLPPLLILFIVNAIRGPILSTPAGVPYFVGVLCGIVLMISGLTPAPPKNEIASEGRMTNTPADFRTTQWSVVLTARQTDSIKARAAMDQLCRAYWPPVYAFVRRRGHAVHDAQDLTQEFFARLLDRDALDNVDPAKGKFRSFLLASMKHFLANEWDKANAQKRGGGKVVFSIDIATAETWFTADPADSQTPEKSFERRWAITVLDQVLQALRDEYVRDGKAELFEQLKPTLAGAGQADAYSEIAGRLSMTEGAVKTAVHRLRQRYRELLRAQIAETVASPDEIEDEIRSLFAAVQ